MKAQFVRLTVTALVSVSALAGTVGLVHAEEPLGVSAPEQPMPVIGTLIGDAIGNSANDGDEAAAGGGAWFRARPAALDTAAELLPYIEQNGKDSMLIDDPYYAESRDSSPCFVCHSERD